ncbi:hypothetical protein KUCAC02_019462 [Chaenocephalus aceratus]|uniref:Uncharacterized protein n=1 Tax=Chaenocephalus aceratus TaxID=36190 RepID=A0ACB9VNG5_CHAAC|nr:hypothetical protein KUCAC02_019462 [Chaenocephalus aceratus]
MIIMELRVKQEGFPEDNTTTVSTKFDNRTFISFCKDCLNLSKAGHPGRITGVAIPMKEGYLMNLRGKLNKNKREL